MIKIWLDSRHYRPSNTEAIRKDVSEMSFLPQGFNLIGVTYGKVDTNGDDFASVDQNKLALLVDTPNNRISSATVSQIVTALGNKWGSQVTHDETVIE